MSAEEGRGRPRVEAQRFDTGARWLDLVATVGNAYGPAPVERLPDVERLGQWLRREDLEPLSAAGERDLERTRDLREVLRPLGLAAARGRSVPDDAIGALNEVMTLDQPLRITVRDGALVCDPPQTTEVALARVAREAATDLTSERARQLRTCDDEVCGLLYLDLTGRRRWCAANVCGVRHRVRAHRRRGHDTDR